MTPVLINRHGEQLPNEVAPRNVAHSRIVLIQPDRVHYFNYTGQYTTAGDPIYLEE